MGFNFPDTPVEDQTFTPAGGPTYVYKSPRWLVKVTPAAAGVTTDDAAPSSPVDGQLWYRSNTGDTFIWYDDGTSSQWVQVNVLPATGQFPVATAQTRNRIVNGAMQISQEQTSTTVNGGYFADQWLLAFSGGGTVTASQVISASGVNPRHQGRLLVGTADTSIAAGDYLAMFHYIEANRMPDFFWGSAAALPAVLRFNGLAVNAASTGTYYVSLRDGTGTVSFVAPFTLTTGFQDFTIPIPACTIGTWPVDTSKGLTLSFAFAAGTTWQAPSNNVWASGSYMAGSTISNGWGTAANDFRISKVGLYLDPQNTGVAPAWQMPDEADELRACQRYFLMLGDKGAGDGVGVGNAAGTTSGHAVIQFPVIMRSAPAMSVSAVGDFGVTSPSSSAITCTAVTLAASFTSNYVVQAAVASGLTGGNAIRFYALNANSRFKLSARM